MKTRPRTVFWLTAGALAFAGLVLFLTVQYVSQNPDEANLGAQVIRVQAERMAQRIEETGPLPFQDPNGDRDVYLQHTGDDAEKGWVLVLAYPAGREGERRCAITWDAKRDEFRSPCTGSTHPPDGAGLTTFPAPVEDGKVVIDLRG
ncbi:MAG TPA: hypothetical protein VHF47_06755 [Acidimicrobiales bacterium]|nr:hypothetical protein [Acidimicrobiales bacterium]